MKILKSILIIGFILLSFANTTFAISTGSFDFTYSFKNENRTISCFVPTDYDTNNQYAVFIGLHGAGDNSVSYRNVLIANAKWNTLFPNTIFIFPDGGSDQAKDFYTPAGDEAIIDSLIEWVSKTYKIDNSKIYLQGFSLGGRSALKYGLDNPTKIAGLLLHTPAMQSPLDVQNNPNFSSIFNYNNANKIPISIAHGSVDYGFLNTVKMLSDSLVEHDAKLMYLLIDNMAHTITPNQTTSIMFKFLTTPITEAAPILHKLNGKIIYYNNKVILNCRMRNLGETAITSLTFDYTIDGVKKSFDWTGNLTNDNFVDVKLPETDLADGIHNVSIFCSKFNGTSQTEMPMFNKGEFFFNVFTNGIPVPFKEDFADVDKVSENFAIQESGNYISWMPDTNKNGCMFMVNTLLAYTNYGLVESMYSNKFDFTKATKPFLSFDVAYNYCYYLPPYFTAKTIFSDTLQVSISNDDWKTSTTLFKKWGDDLRTFNSPFENPLSIQAFLIAPKSNEWKTFDIDLNNYNVTNKTMFKMDYISGSGGVIYFDNFSVYDKDAISVENEKEFAFAIYPNQISSNENIVMTIDANDFEVVKIELYNSTGQKVADLLNWNLTKGNNSYAINIPKLAVGMYFIKAITNNSEKTANLIIN